MIKPRRSTVPLVDGKYDVPFAVVIWLLFIALCSLSVGHSGRACAADLPPSVVATTPDEMTWATTGLALPGMTSTYLVGSPDKPGECVLRLRFPAGYTLQPHWHPHARTVTVLRGVWQTGYGTVYDAAALKSLPAGSFYTEPSNLPHFTHAETDVELQVTDTCPGERVFVGKP